MTTLTSTELYKSFPDYQNSPYNGATLTVTGTVSYVGPDSYGLPCIEFGDPATGRAEVAFITPNDDDLVVGQDGIITGHCEGFTQGMVILKHCHMGA